MIKINKIVPFTCEAFDPEGNSLGFINEYEFNDLRLQIARAKAEGYYMMHEGKKVYLNNRGLVVDWPENGFYHLYGKQLSELFKMD